MPEIFGRKLEKKTERQLWWKSWEISVGISGEIIAWSLVNVGNLGRNPNEIDWGIIGWSTGFSWEIFWKYLQ